MCWFLAGSGYLRGLIWSEGIRRNLGLLEGLELIFEHGMDGGWLGRREIYCLLEGDGEGGSTIHTGWRRGLLIK